MTTKLDIPLRGVALDNLMAVDENPILKIETSKAKSEKALPAEVGRRTDSLFCQARKSLTNTCLDLEKWESKSRPRNRTFRKSFSPWTEGEKTILFIRVDYSGQSGRTD